MWPCFLAMIWRNRKPWQLTLMGNLYSLEEEDLCMDDCHMYSLPWPQAERRNRSDVIPPTDADNEPEAECPSRGGPKKRLLRKSRGAQQRAALGAYDSDSDDVVLPKQQLREEVKGLPPAQGCQLGRQLMLGEMADSSLRILGNPGQASVRMWWQPWRICVRTIWPPMREWSMNSLTAPDASPARGRLELPMKAAGKCSYSRVVITHCPACMYVRKPAKLWTVDAKIIKTHFESSHPVNQIGLQEREIGKGDLHNGQTGPRWAKAEAETGRRGGEAYQSCRRPWRCSWTTETCPHMQGWPPFIRGKGLHVLLLHMPVLAHPEAKKLGLLTKDKQEINLLVAKARKGFALAEGMLSSLKTRYHGGMLQTPDMKVKVDREIADTGMDPWHQVDLLCDAVMEYSLQPFGQHKVCMEVLLKYEKGEEPLTLEERRMLAAPRNIRNRLCNVLMYFSPDGKMHVADIIKIPFRC